MIECTMAVHHTNVISSQWNGSHRLQIISSGPRYITDTVSLFIFPEHSFVVFYLWIVLLRRGMAVWPSLMRHYGVPLSFLGYYSELVCPLYLFRDIITRFIAWSQTPHDNGFRTAQILSFVWLMAWIDRHTSNKYWSNMFEKDASLSTNIWNEMHALQLQEQRTSFGPLNTSCQCLPSHSK